MSQPGNHSICGGDFNSLWQLTEDGGGGYRSPLQVWSVAVGWRSRRDDLPSLQKYITRPSSQLTGGSEIDHVLYNSPSIRLRHYSTGTDALWVGLSDHRSILVGFSHLPHEHLQDTPRFNKEFGDLKRLQIKRFAPSAPQLQQFQNQLQSTWRPLSATPLTLEQAEQQLDPLTQITLAAAPDRKKWKKRPPTPPFKPNCLRCSSFNDTLVSFLFHPTGSTGRPHSNAPWASTKSSQNGSAWWPPFVSKGASPPKCGAQRVLLLRNGGLRTPPL